MLWLALREGWITIPPNTLPWQEPDLRAKPGPFSRQQIGRIAADRELCHATLTRYGLSYTPLQDRTLGERCAHTNAVRMDNPPIPFNHRTMSSCGLAVSLLWYQRLIAPIAQRELGATIVRIDHVGTFACRNVNSEKTGSRSEHATANAIDITGFRLSDGRLVSVARDYGRPTPQGRFLDEAHAAACSVFNGVLGPRYNELHATHFHLDRGPYRICS